MDDTNRRFDGLACPHVDRDDHRCNSRFGLDRLEQAFRVCFGAFHTCPMYRRISGEIAHAEAEEERTPMVVITARGSAIPYRATGT